MISSLHVEELALRRGERVLFKGLTFALKAGEAVALTGRNGAGKTSLLRAIAGFIRPETGRVRFEGAEAGAEDIHYLAHQDALKTSRTAREELFFQASWTGGTEAQALKAAARLDLTRLLPLEVRKLSAGQRRRLALARLSASPRSLWLLDEPMAPLDAEHRAGFGALMSEHLAGGGLIVAAVHDPLPIPAAIVDIGP